MATTAQLLQQAGVGQIGTYNLLDAPSKSYDYYKDLLSSGKTISDNLTQLLYLGQAKGTNDPMFLSALTGLATSSLSDAGTKALATRELQVVNTQRSQAGLGVINVAGALPAVAPTLTVTKPTAPAAAATINTNNVTQQNYGQYLPSLQSIGINTSGYTLAQTKTAITNQYNPYLTTQYNNAYTKYTQDLATYTTAKTKYDTDLAAFNAEQAALKPINDAADTTLAASAKSAQDYASQVAANLATQEKQKRAQALIATLGGLAASFTKTPNQVITPSVVLAKSKLGGI